MRHGLVVLVILLSGCAALSGDEGDARARFFAEMKSLCGARFEGKATFAADGGRDVAGKRLVATIAECGPDELRIPFAVAEDLSRTWILRRLPNGLEFKHDHRHADGTPDKVTMYGGRATDLGSRFRQSFAADAYTAELIPAAKTNLWTLTLDENDQGETILTYHLIRDSKPRFTAVLKRVPPIETPRPDFAATLAEALPLCREWHLPHALAAGSSPEVRRNQLNAQLVRLSRTYWWSQPGTAFLRERTQGAADDPGAVCARLLLQLYP